LPGSLRLDWTPAPTPTAATLVARAGRGCPAPEPGTHGRTVAVQPPLCRGRYEGTDTFLGRRRPPPRLAALATSRATEPQYVCGAGTSRLHLYGEMKSAHSPGRRHRQHKKVDKIPLPGIFCLLTTGGLIRVRRHWFAHLMSCCYPLPASAMMRCSMGVTGGTPQWPSSTTLPG
jgi:hypothetical protein